jgi:hypothetical protein
MPQTPTASSSSNFRTPFNAALKAYQAKTKIDLLAHPLTGQLRSCDSPITILAVLQDLAQKFDQRRKRIERLTQSLKTIVNVLYALCPSLGAGDNLVNLQLWSRDLGSDFTLKGFLHAKVIFTGIGVLLLVCIFFSPSYKPFIRMPGSIRRPKKSIRLKAHSSISSSESKPFSGV